MGNPRDDLCGYVDRQGWRGATPAEAARALGGDSRQVIAAWDALSRLGRIVHTGQYRQIDDRTERVYVTGPGDQDDRGALAQVQPRD